MRSNNMMRIAALSAFLCSSAFADTLKSATEARNLSDQILEKVVSGDLEGGLKIAQPFIVVGQPELDVMAENMRLLQPAERNRYGKHIGHEFIREDRVGKNVMRIVQTERFKRRIKVWNFYFYRGQNGWFLNSINADNEIQQLFLQ